MAIEVPLTNSQPSLTRILKHIQTAGVPSKVDVKYLKSMGFKSGNDGYLVPILKKIGFLSAAAVPEQSWRSYKNLDQAPKILADGVPRAFPG